MILKSLKFLLLISAFSILLPQFPSKLVRSAQAYPIPGIYLISQDVAGIGQVPIHNRLGTSNQAISVPSSGTTKVICGSAICDNMRQYYTLNVTGNNMICTYGDLNDNANSIAPNGSTNVGFLFQTGIYVETGPFVNNRLDCQGIGGSATVYTLEGPQ